MLTWISLMNLAGGDGTAPTVIPVQDPSRYRSGFRATDYLVLLLSLFGV